MQEHTDRRLIYSSIIPSVVQLTILENPTKLVFNKKYLLSHLCPSPVDEGEIDTGDDGIKIGWDEVARHIL